MNNQRLIRTLSLVLTLVISSGCRFGNYADAPKPNFKETYKTVELYFTQPSNLATTVVFDDNTTHESAHAPLSAIPADIRNNFTNPVYFAIPIDTNYLPRFIDIYQTTALTTQLDNQGNIADDYAADPVVLYKNPNCQTQVEIIQNGSFDPAHQGTVTFSDGSSSPVSGHLKLTLSYLRVISGDCQADLQELANCYSNGTGCDTNQLDKANGLFDLYVRQTGVLNISDATRVRGLAFEVQFE